MARVIKISEKQFVLDCVNKEFELVGSSLHWETFEELKDWAALDENNAWYEKYEFTSSQYDAFKEYFLKHFYDWQPKRIPARIAEKEFSWFNLMYGFSVKDNG